MHTFDLKIHAVDASLFDGPAEYCRITTDTGSMGIEARHEAFFAPLRADSEIVVRDQAGRHTFPIHQGLLTFRSNTCWIAVESRRT